MTETQTTQTRKDCQKMEPVLKHESRLEVHRDKERPRSGEGSTNVLSPKEKEAFDDETALPSSDNCRIEVESPPSIATQRKTQDECGPLVVHGVGHFSDLGARIVSWLWYVLVIILLWSEESMVRSVQVLI